MEPTSPGSATDLTLCSLSRARGLCLCLCLSLSLLPPPQPPRTTSVSRRLPPRWLWLPLALSLSASLPLCLALSLSRPPSRRSPHPDTSTRCFPVRPAVARPRGLPHRPAPRRVGRAALPSDRLAPPPSPVLSSMAPLRSLLPPNLKCASEIWSSSTRPPGLSPRYSSPALEAEVRSFTQRRAISALCSEGPFPFTTPNPSIRRLVSPLHGRQTTRLGRRRPCFLPRDLAHRSRLHASSTPAGLACARTTTSSYLPYPSLPSPPLPSSTLTTLRPRLIILCTPPCIALLHA